MSDLKIDAITQDLVFDNGDLVLVSSTDAAVQFLRQRLKFFLGEWFLETSLGIPFFQSILIKQPEAAVVKSIFLVTILESPGVESIDSFSFDYDGPTRKLSLDFTCTINSETIDFSEELTT